MKTIKALLRCALPVAAALVVVAAWRHGTHTQAVTVTADKANDISAVRAVVASRASPHLGSTAPGPAELALDLDALRKSLAGRADTGEEVARIVAFARFRDRVAAYGRDEDTMSGPERSQRARQILAELPEHVARNEIAPVQAEVMTAALLGDAEPDPIARAADWEASHRQWDRYARQTVGPSPAQDGRYRDYIRQSREIVAQVQSSVLDPQQQQIVIAQRLQALRVQLFDPTPPPAAH